MNRTTQGLLVVLLATGLAVGGTGCAKKSSETAGTSTTTTEEVRVTQVDLGRGVGTDKRVTDQTDSFQPGDPVYATVVTSGAAPTATLKARWTYQDGQVVDESEQTIAPTGDAATEFHISKPDGFPVGKYKLEVFLNGASVQTKDFEVKA